MGSYVVIIMTTKMELSIPERGGSCNERKAITQECHYYKYNRFTCDVAIHHHKLQLYTFIEETSI